jgi:hypothetical protein
LWSEAAKTLKSYCRKEQNLSKKREDYFPRKTIRVEGKIFQHLDNLKIQYKQGVE